MSLKKERRLISRRVDLFKKRFGIKKEKDRKPLLILLIGAMLSILSFNPNFVIFGLSLSLLTFYILSRRKKF